MNAKNEIDYLARIKHLEVELEKLKKSLPKPSEEKWKPYKDGFYISEHGIVYWTDDLEYDSSHNCFRTKELAQLRAKQREAEDELFNIWEHLVGDWRPNWNTQQEEKWFFHCEPNGKEYYYSTYRTKSICPEYRYFPTKELAMKQYELASDHARAYMRGEF